MRNPLLALPVIFLSFTLLIAMGCNAQNRVRATTKVNQAAQRQVATVETEPIYALQVEDLVRSELKQRRSSTSIFHEPSPEELARLRGQALHGLLLEAVYKKPGVKFNKTRAQAHTREITLAQARAIRDALESGMDRQEVLDTLVEEPYRAKSQVDFDILDTQISNPAYKEQALETPVGGVSQIIEDSDGLWVIRVLRREKDPSGATRVVGEQYFVHFDKEAGKRKVKEEDLARSRVVVQDPSLRAIRHINTAEDTDDTVQRLKALTAARKDLEEALKGQPDHFTHFLMGWVLTSLSADPTSGATKEAALEQFRKATNLLEKSQPGDQSLAFYRARIAALQRDLGQEADAKASYRAAFEAAKDNYPLTVDLAKVFTDLGDTEYAGKAEAEIARMEKSMNYSALAGAGRIRQKPGIMAEAARGMDQVFEVEGEPRVHQ
ncbi:MAG TPA: hypothetical protein VEI97_18295 [bacterium]|nr:hypothetical protein [bacterium]